MTHRASATVLAALLAATACGKGDSARAGDSTASAATAAAAPGATSTSPDQQLADIGEYRLTMDKYDQYLVAQRNILRKAESMSAAEREAARARNAGNNANGTLDDMVRNVEREPLMHDAVREAGLSAREFTLITMSLMQTAMAAGVAQSRPNDNQDSLIRAMKANPDNVKFFRANEAELTRKQKELEAEAKRVNERIGQQP